MPQARATIQIVQPSLRLSQHVQAHVCGLPLGDQPSFSDIHQLPASLLGGLVVVHHGSMELADGSGPIVGPTLMGVRTRPGTVRVQGPLEFTLSLIRPGAIEDILGIPASSVCNASRDVSGLFSCLELSRLSVCSAASCIQVVEDLLLSRLLCRPSYKRAFAQEVERALKGLEQMSVRQLAASLGLSSKTLLRRAIDVYGISPKLLLRMARVEAAMRSMQDGGVFSPLAAVAQDCGFVDQAHLSREFRALFGRSPTEIRNSWSGQGPPLWPWMPSSHATHERHLATLLLEEAVSVERLARVAC